MSQSLAWLPVHSFENQGNGNFVEANASGFMGNDGKSYGNAIGDLNQDGYYDIAVNNSMPDPFHIWKSSGGVHGWISLQLEGVSSNRDGIGSWIEVVAGGVRQVHYTHCGTSYLGQKQQPNDLWPWSEYKRRFDYCYMAEWDSRCLDQYQ